MKKLFYSWFPVFIYASVIFILSSFPIQIPKGSDKILHLFEYLFFGILATRAILLTWNVPQIWGLFLGTLSVGIFGSLDEYHQSFVPGRHASLGDAAVDFLGALLGGLLFLGFGIYLYKSNRLYPDPHRGCAHDSSLQK